MPGASDNKRTKETLRNAERGFENFVIGNQLNYSAVVCLNPLLNIRSLMKWGRYSQSYHALGM